MTDDIRVTAECHDCDDVHPLGERAAGWTTTMCPECASTSYETTVDGEREVTHRERVRRALEDVEGVGERSLSNLLQRFHYEADLEAASVEDLTAVPHVGEQTARNIQEAV